MILAYYFNIDIACNECEHWRF